MNRLLRLLGPVLTVLAAIAAVSGFCYWIYAEIRDENRIAAKFMSDCQADGRKEYECLAMWRAGENHTAVVPVPIYVGR